MALIILFKVFLRIALEGRVMCGDAAAPTYDALAERFGFDGEAGASFFLAAPAADDFM